MIFMKKEGDGATSGQDVEGQEIGQVETEEPLGEDEPSTSTTKKPGNSMQTTLLVLERETNPDTSLIWGYP